MLGVELSKGTIFGTPNSAESAERIVVEQFLAFDITKMKRGNYSDTNSKRVNSENPSTEDTTNLVFEDPFIDQYEEEEIVDGNEEDEEMAEEEFQNEQQEGERHDVCGRIEESFCRSSVLEETSWRRVSSWTLIIVLTVCTTASMWSGPA